jgi:hypothetical protein
MAYVAGLYTRASQASSDEAARFRQFQTDIDVMAERDRQGIMRQQTAQMDQFTAGLTPRSDVAAPDWTAPSAPPAPSAGLNTAGAGGTGADASANYERQRLMQERKLIENQYNAEATAHQTHIENLGKQKYVLEQQLSVAPPSRVQAIRNEIMRIDAAIGQTITGARSRVTEYTTLFKNIDEAIRSTDKGQAIMSGGVPAAPDGYMPGSTDGDTPAMPDGMGAKPQPIPVPDSLGMPSDPAQPAPAPVPAAAAPPVAPVLDANEQTYLASLTAEQFLALPKAQQDAILAKVNRERQTNRDRANFLTLPAAAADFATLPFDGLIKLFNVGSEAVDLPRFARVIGIDVDSIQIPYPGGDRLVSETPWIDLARTLAASSEPLTREQFIENLKATPVEQQSAAPAAAPPPTAGVTPPTTPEAAAAATPVLQATADVPIGDPADPRVAAITQYSAQSVATRAPELVSNIGTAVQSDQGQALISRAKALGVDPAAAIAIYGLESSFGAKGGTSGAGAGGPLQVMPAQVTNLKTWFNNAKNIAQYNISPEVVAAAKAMTPDSIDAGLLQLKYNELIGLPKNLWGAGYQADANKVLKAGTPLPAHDAGTGTKGLTNSDYNKLYVTLYNEARGIVNIPPSTTTSTEGVIGNSQTIRQIDTQRQQLTSDYDFAVETLNAERYTTVTKYEELTRRMEIARQFSDLTAYEAARTELEALDTVLRDNDVKLRQVETLTRMEIGKLDLARTDEYIKMAVMELDALNPEPFAEMVSRVTGMSVEIVPIEGGRFAVYQNNRLVSGKGYTLKELKDQYLSPINEQYAVMRAEQEKEARAFNSDMMKEDLKLARDITLEQVKASGEMEKQGWTENKEVTDETGRVTERWYAKGRQIIRMRIEPDREENGLVVRGGVIIEDVTKAGLK